MTDRLLFPASIIGSMPRPDFVKDLIADDCPFSPDEYQRLMGAAIRSVVALQEAAGLDVVVAVKQLPGTFRGWLHASGGGIIKLIADRKTGILVGATVAGPHGGEMLGLLTLAVHARVPLAELRSMIYAFPTFYGGIGEAVGAYGRGLVTVIDPAYQGLKALDTVGAAEGD